ncbi:MAG: hypothetical protein ACI80M_001099 [Gammaproteobacteria bacterium]|jgi:hypothetical protein|tara:strand:+ start:157 stop:1059 length:903 start_codon:yes stop_codon:yes gene_type:complete
MSDATNNLIMVCGASRSGTTMLDLMLGSSDSAFSCGEIYALFRPYRTHHFNPDCCCGAKPCLVWSKLGKLNESEFHAAALAQTGIHHVVDSSKDLNWVLDSNHWASHQDVPVKNVLLWKQPIDLAYSHWKRGRPIDYYRRAFLNYHERFLDLRLPFVTIGFEELVDAPEKILKKVCSYTQVEWHEGQEEFWQKQHHHLFGSAGTFKQVNTGDSKIRSKEDFPADFLAAWGKTAAAQGHDERLNDVISALGAADIVLGTPANPNAKLRYSGPAKPFWYYHHALKYMYQKRFPVQLSSAEST